MESRMFDTILELPLFQGLGRDDLTRILESTHLTFETLPEHATLCRQDEPCTGLTFVIEGELLQNTRSANRQWSVDEWVGARTVIGLNALYGSSNAHRHTYSAACPTRLMHVDKRTAKALVNYFEVFRLNVLNGLTTQHRAQMHALWLPGSDTLEGHIVGFMRSHVTRPAGRKVFHMSQQTLGQYVNADYRYVCRALDRLAAKGLLAKKYKAIQVPAFEALTTHFNQNSK